MATYTPRLDKACISDDTLIHIYNTDNLYWPHELWQKTRSRPPYIHHALRINLPTGSMNNLTMAHLQARNMYLLLPDDVVLLTEYR
jgi:hypothetical protein